MIALSRIILITAGKLIFQKFKTLIVMNGLCYSESDSSKIWPRKLRKFSFSQYSQGQSRNAYCSSLDSLSVPHQQTYHIQQ